MHPKLLKWCAKRGIEVSVGTEPYESVYYPTTKKIVLACKLTPKTQMYHLLHECGHHLFARNPGNHLGDAHLADFHEEVEAWSRGRRLAARLKIKVDDRHWRRERNACLRYHLHRSTK